MPPPDTFPRWALFAPRGTHCACSSPSRHCLYLLSPSPPEELVSGSLLHLTDSVALCRALVPETPRDVCTDASPPCGPSSGAPCSSLPSCEHGSKKPPNSCPCCYPEGDSEQSDGQPRLRQAYPLTILKAQRPLRLQGSPDTGSEVSSHVPKAPFDPLLLLDSEIQRAWVWGWRSAG